MASAVGSVARDWPSYWAMEWHERNSKCKSTQREPSKGGMAEMGDVGSGRRGAWQEAREDKRGAMVVLEASISTGASRGAIGINVCQERSGVVVGWH